MRSRPTLLACSLLALWGLSAGAVGADTSATRPATRPSDGPIGTPAAGSTDPVDFNKARSIYERGKRGEKLTAEERAYVERAKASRRQAGGDRQSPTSGSAAPEPRESTGLVPIDELKGDYHGFSGGLYGQGQNTPPEAQQALAKAASSRIQPLDAEGKPAPAGKIVLLGLGMSNTTMEFSAFKSIADPDAAKAANVVVVDGAQGGKAADDWVDPAMPTFREASRRLEAAGVHPSQVQAVWIKQAMKGPAGLGAFPQHAKVLQDDIEKMLRAVRTNYPNVQVAYLSSRIYAGYATSALNPEPFAYEGAFSVQWVIAKQVSGDASLNADSARGAVKAPVVLWGPYLWADGTKGRSADTLKYVRDDFVSDGTHPSPSGRRKVADLLLAFFKSDDNAKGWFCKK